MHQIKKLLFSIFSAFIIIGCVKTINSPVGSWKGEIETTIDSQGGKMKKTSNYQYTLYQDGYCTIYVKNIWDIDGLKTRSEFKGLWHQESNIVTVQYNLLDEKKVSSYATTPRNWNEVRHVFTINYKLMNMNGKIEGKEINLVKKSSKNFRKKILNIESNDQKN